MVENSYGVVNEADVGHGKIDGATGYAAGHQRCCKPGKISFHCHCLQPEVTMILFDVHNIYVSLK